MAKLEIEVLGDVKSLETALAKAKADLAKFKRQAEQNATSVTVANQKAGGSFAMLGGKADGAFKSLRSPGGLFAGGLVASAGLDQAKAAIDVASNLNEQMSKSSVVFGTASQSVLDWSKTTAKGIGVAQDQALEAAATFGNLTRAMGIGQSESADLSKTLVNLAGDLASFNNASPEDALLALRSAVVGEYEPLRRFGSALSEARVQQQALAETGKKSAKELTNQEKVTARYHLILKDTALAQGDFARTSDGLANKQRTLAAEARNLQANIGTLLIPVMEKLTSNLVTATDGVNTLITSLGKLGDLNIGPIEIPLSFKAPTGTLDKLGNPTSFNPIYDWLFNPVTGGTMSALEKLGLAPGAKPAAMPLFSSFSNMSMAGLPGGPGAGGPIRTLPKISAFGPGSTGMDVLQTQLPLGFQNAIDAARLSGNKSELLKGLVGAKQFLTGMVGQATTEEDKAKLLSGLAAVQSEIQGVYSDRAAEAEATKNKLMAARAEAKRKAQEQADKAAAAIESASTAMRDGLESAAKAAEGLRDAMRAQADKFKSEALARLDRTQAGRDTSRALQDARAAMAKALQIGGPMGIQAARRDLEDAKLARQRYLLEGSSVTKGASGFNVNGGLHLHGITSVDQLIAELQRRARGNTSQSRGRNPGGLYGLPH